MAILRLDPALPIVWRSPRALQLGALPPRVVLDPVSGAEERMLAALRGGIRSEALAAIGRCSESTARAFLGVIRPALQGAAPEPIRAQVRIRSAAFDAIAGQLRDLRLIETPRGARPRLGLVVADHAVPLRAYRDWLREAVPHFAVVFGSDAVTVGPLVLPGRTGCLRCADLARRDEDEAWPAVATQLAALPAATSSDPLVRTEALCAAARLAGAALRGEVPASGRRIVRGGRRDEVRIDPHPECGCTLDLQVPAA